MSADRNLLYGMLAYQHGFVTREQLLDAFAAWMGRQDAPLGELLRQRASLTEDDRRFLDAFVERQLGRGGDAEPDPATKASLGTRTDARPDPPVADDGPPQLGRFRVVRFHARGGLGEVHVARDEELRREVALKQIQARFAADPESRRRFVLEAEVTGRLEHPGVVPVYGLVADAAGRPYYAMRFIQGESLHDAIRRFHDADRPGRDPGERAMALRDLLGRFVAVCHAVGFAHSKGVIHRDLKPANVMLGDFGETLVVDWGLAKVTPAPPCEEPPATPRLTAGGRPAETALGQAVGTVAFMPPEQARGDHDFVGPQSDVFSLGATLYCLLTGRPPYSGPDALARAQAGVVTPARQVKRGVPPALEAVCRKAMAPWQADRYPSAKALADDVGRWLADEPVGAYRDPPLARAARWGRKRRSLVAAAAASLVVGLAAASAGLAVVGGLNGRLRASNDRLGQALADAARERDVAVAVNRFLREDLLGQADIGNQEPGGDQPERDRNVTVTTLLDRAAKKIDGRFPGQEETEASIRQTIGRAYMALGRYDEALPHLERCAAVRAQRLGPGHPDALTSQDELGVLYFYLGRYDRAEPLLIEALRQAEKRLGPGHPDTLDGKNNLASLYKAQGRHDRAEPLFLEVLRWREEALGPAHPLTLISKNNLASLYHAQSRFDQAEPLYQQVLEQQAKQLGPDHPHTLNSKNNLAGLHLDRGRLDRAEPLLVDVVRQREKKLGPDHPHTLISKNNLAGLYLDQSRLDQAVPLLQEVLHQQKKKLGPDHPDTLRSMSNLAVLYLQQGRLDQAEPLLREAAELRGKKLGPDHPATLATKGHLAELYQRQGNHAEAEPLLREYLRAAEKGQPDAWSTFNARSSLGNALLRQKKYADAEPLLVQGYEGLKRRQDKIPPPLRAARLREALGRLVSLYDALGKKDEAARYRQELADLRRAVKGSDKP